MYKVTIPLRAHKEKPAEEPQALACAVPRGLKSAALRVLPAPLRTLVLCHASLDGWHGCVSRVQVADIHGRHGRATHQRNVDRALAWLMSGAVLLAAVGWPLPAARADGDAIAIVNGRSISKRKMMDTLMESHGLQILQQLIVLDLTKQETRRLGIRVTAGDVDREFERALMKIAPRVDADGQKLTEDEKRQALDYLLNEKCLSSTEFMIGMERNAHLRKLAARDFRVDEATLREEYARLYGEKVEVRCIQVGDVDGLHEALNRLDKGDDFADVARAVSRNESAKEGGLLEPFTMGDEDIAPVLRDAAFSLKAGERTMPIKVGRWWFILKLKQRIAPTEARFEDVREEVTRELRNRVIPQKMNRLVTELFQKAEIKVLDRELKRKFEELLEKSALTDAATMP